jgi:cytochrome c-type biogenesis protein CcmF
MNPGNILLLLSLLISTLSLIFLARGAGGRQDSMPAARWMFYTSGAITCAAFVLLLAAFIGHRFEYAYVYNYSSLDLPLAYLVSGVWAGQEGTFLLWALLLFVFGFFVTRKRDDFEPIVMTVITVTQIFLLLMLVAYSPFRYVWQVNPEHFKTLEIPADGSGLTQLLQDFWMVIHPPVLFLGYASSVIPFAYAAAALIRRDAHAWVRPARPWVLFSTATLGTGIFLGGYWAYRVLGWGGYWGWDPVENSSLIPWLVMVALVHGLLIQRRKRALARTNIGLALTSFILVFFSTFLTRSGVLADFSVHSFGDLGLSRHLILFLGFYLVIAAFLTLRNIASIKGEGLGERIFSWDTLMTFGIVTLCFYAFFILVGTSMPIISPLFSKTPFTVKQGFYNAVSIPLGTLLLLFIVLSGLSQIYASVNRIRLLFGVIIAITLAVLLNIWHTTRIEAYVFSALGFFLLLLCIRDFVVKKPGRILASRLAHAGVAVMAVGIIASGYHSASFQEELHAGVREQIGGITLTFRGITQQEKSSLKFTVTRGKKIREIETPYFIEKKMRSLYREPHVIAGAYEDVYISPVQYVSGAEAVSRILLEKSAQAEAQGMKLTFTGFDIDRAHMMSGQAVLYAKIDVLRGAARESVKPGLRMSGDGGRESVGARLSTGQAVTLLDFDVSSGRVVISMEPAAGAQLPPDSAMVDVSFKRLIWLVWLGTVLTGAGLFIAMRKTGEEERA